MADYFSGEPINKTSTGDVVATRDVYLEGFYVNSTSSGVITLKRGGSSGTAIGGNITPAIGFHRYPCFVKGGLHMTLASGSIDVTFFVEHSGN